MTTRSNARTTQPNALNVSGAQLYGSEAVCVRAVMWYAICLKREYKVSEVILLDKQN